MCSSDLTPGHHQLVLQAFAGSRVVETRDDAVIVTIEVRDYQSFIDRMLCFGTNVLVREPDILVQRIVDVVRAMAEA